MISLPMVIAGIAGLAASWLARRLAVRCQRIIGARHLLPQIAADLRKLVTGTDTSSFLAEYLRLLKQFGWLAMLQFATLALNLLTMCGVYVLACWPLDFGPSQPRLGSLSLWLSDVEFAFLVTAAVGSLIAPLLVRSPA